MSGLLNPPSAKTQWIVTLVAIIVTVISFIMSASALGKSGFDPRNISASVSGAQLALKNTLTSDRRSRFLGSRGSGPEFWENNADLQSYYAAQGGVDPTQDSSADVAPVVVPNPNTPIVVAPTPNVVAARERFGSPQNAGVIIASNPPRDPDDALLLVNRGISNIA